MAPTLKPLIKQIAVQGASCAIEALASVDRKRRPAATLRMRPSTLRFLAPFVLAALPLGGCATSTHLGRSDLSRVAGRTYVVVGASSGFGHGAAIRLGELRANVVLAARRTDLLE